MMVKNTILKTKARTELATTGHNAHISCRCCACSENACIRITTKQSNGKVLLLKNIDHYNVSATVHNIYGNDTTGGWP